MKAKEVLSLLKISRVTLWSYTKLGKIKTTKLDSEILNTLDGFNDKNNIVRFFTCNDYEKIKKVDALVNRMNRQFEFSYPTREIFSDKFDILLKIKTDVDSNKKNTFIDLVCNVKNLTLRPFTSYVIRYMFYENYLDQMINHIFELE